MVIHREEGLISRNRRMRISLEGEEEVSGRKAYGAPVQQRKLWGEASFF